MKPLHSIPLALIAGVSLSFGAGTQATGRKQPSNGQKIAPPKLSGKIAFSSNRNDISSIYVMNADGTHQTPITKGDTCQYPCFSPDGTKIVYAGFPFSHAEFYIVNADGTGSVFLDATLGDIQPHFSFSPSGKQIVYTSGNSKAEIYLINADRTGKTQLTKDGGYSAGYFHPSSYYPCFSPDGKQIVFVSDRDWTHVASGSSNEIFVMNADGTNQTRLTHNDDDDGSPCFSPDGKRIAYASVRGGQSQIFVMNADGTHSVRLTKDNGATPCFSPDGKQIAYSFKSKGWYGIFVMNADGTNPVRLTSGRVDYSPSWSSGSVPVPIPEKKSLKR